MEQIQPYLNPEILNSLITKGDISALTTNQKNEYYKWYCERLGLDAAAQPFKILKLQGKETLYLDRSGAQQLNALHNVSHQITAREEIKDLYVVSARASSNGRFTESIGAVNIKNLSGDALANAMMKAETKAKRRATLDLLGLGILDETEVETIPNAKVLELTGENVSVSNVIEAPDIRDFREQILACKTVDEVSLLRDSMTDDEKKAWKVLLQGHQITLAEADIDNIIKNLRKNSTKSFPFIESIIDKQVEPRKTELINAYNSKLEKLGLDHRYEPTPF